MIEISFAGWFQSRLATDPDATDDPRGTSGWTFAFPGEPNLDRTIRFQNPVAPRSRSPVVNVVVDQVGINGVAIAGHPLLGASVELLDSPKFEGQNGAIAASAHEPIAPFHVRIGQKNIFVEGFDPIDLSDPNDVARRGPNSFSPRAKDVLALLQINDPGAYRKQRLDQLKQDRLTETDPIRQAALDGRIAQLGMTNIQRNSLGFKVTYDFALGGPNRVTDPGHTLGAAPAGGSPWRAQFWMGGWDADALSGYVKGSISIP